MSPSSSNAPASRRSTLAVAAALVLALFLGFYVYSRMGSAPVDTKVASAGQNSHEKPESIPSPAPLEKPRLQDPKMGKTLTPAEEREVQVRLEKVEAEFRRMEQANTKWVGEVDEEEMIVVMYIITAPTEDRYSAYADVLKSAMEDLPDSVKDATYDRRKELMDQYTNFSTPYTLITGIFPYERDGQGDKPKRKIGFSETYVTKEGSLTIFENGSYRYDGESTGARGMFPDGKVPRYGYLFKEYFPNGNAEASKK